MIYGPDESMKAIEILLNTSKKQKKQIEEIPLLRKCLNP